MTADGFFLTLIITFICIILYVFINERIPLKKLQKSQDKRDIEKLRDIIYNYPNVYFRLPNGVCLDLGGVHEAIERDYHVEPPTANRVLIFDLNYKNKEESD